MSVRPEDKRKMSTSLEKSKIGGEVKQQVLRKRIIRSGGGGGRVLNDNKIPSPLVSLHALLLRNKFTDDSKEKEVPLIYSSDEEEEEAK